MMRYLSYRIIERADSRMEVRIGVQPHPIRPTTYVYTIS